jgi:hypothetical protein
MSNFDRFLIDRGAFLFNISRLRRSLRGRLYLYMIELGGEVFLLCALFLRLVCSAS